MLDLPSANASEAGGEDVGRPLVAEHNSLDGLEAELLHGFGELGGDGLFGPPDAGDAEWLAELLHHLFATVVGDDGDFDASVFAILNPVGEFVSGLFFGVQAEGIVKVAEEEFDFFAS